MTNLKLDLTKNETELLQEISDYLSKKSPTETIKEMIKNYMTVERGMDSLAGHHNDLCKSHVKLCVALKNLGEEHL